MATLPYSGTPSAIKSPVTDKSEPELAATPSQDPESGNGHDKADLGQRSWLPIPLRPVFAIILTTVTVVLAIAIEIAWHYSENDQGWTVHSVNLAFGNGHSVYTLPLAILAMIIVGFWAWTDAGFRRLQPYIDLSKGSAPAEKSLLLDYTSTSKFVVWIPAYKNRHYAAVLSTFAALLALVLQPLASNFFVIRETLLSHPSVSIVNRNVVGLDPDYATLTPFVTAAGYAEAAALYAIGDPAFIKGGWTIGEFDLPTQYGQNGTITMNTVGILSKSGCDFADRTNFTVNAANDGYNLNATWSGCSALVNIDTSAVTQYGATPVVTSCPADLANLDNQFKPVMFWMITYDSKTPGATKYDSLTFCRPSIAIYNVVATVDLSSGSLLDVEIVSNYTGSNNVTGTPLNGQAFNGINFDLTGVDKYTLARANATQSGLPSAIFQAAENAPGGLFAIYTADNVGFVNLTDRVYTQFLALSAKNVYFLEGSSTGTAVVSSYQIRVWITTYVAHTLTAALLVIALLGGLAHLISAHDRRSLHLRTEPGTLGSAASMTANPEVLNLFQGHENQHGLRTAVKDKRFKTDRATGAIVLD